MCFGVRWHVFWDIPIIKIFVAQVFTGSLVSNDFHKKINKSYFFLKKKGHRRWLEKEKQIGYFFVKNSTLRTFKSSRALQNIYPNTHKEVFLWTLCATSFQNTPKQFETNNTKYLRTKPPPLLLLLTAPILTFYN